MKPDYTELARPHILIAVGYEFVCGILGIAPLGKNRWLSNRRLRFPFGLHIWSVFRKWTATGMQLRANMQTAQLANGKWILVEDERAKFEQALYDRGVVDAVTLDINHAHFLRSRNKSQGWDKNGNEIKGILL